MKPCRISIALLVVFLFLAPALFAQSPDAANPSTASSASAIPAGEVPRLIKFSGTLLDEQGHALSGPVGVTFALYAQQSGGAALWLETQNVKPDASGNYTVLLGANSANGVPAELFVSGEVRWLGIQVGQQPEHERILLVSVPYALKAGDAETLGGKPLSSFVLNDASAIGSSAGSAAVATSSTAGKTPTATGAGMKPNATPQAVTPCSSITSDGTVTVNSIGLFTTACNIESSLMSQGTVNGFPGINLAGNNAGLLMSGTGTHEVTVTGSSSSGRLGQDAQGFFFASDTNGKVIKFDTNNGTLNEWMRITSAGNVGIHTQTPAATLDINGNLNLPNTANATVGVISLGGTPFLHNFGSQNTFVGASAGNMTMTGNANSALGTMALIANSSGVGNSAFGVQALQANNTGSFNAAFGVSALQANTTGQSNAAFGVNTLLNNTTGIQDAAFGNGALERNTTASFNSAFGVQALHLNTIGQNNAAFGFNALFANNDPTNANNATNNAAFGFEALQANTTGSGNSAFGATALLNNTTGPSNSAFGLSALFANTTGFGNSAFGSLALFANTTSSGNSAFGGDALLNNTTGPSNSAFGLNALESNTIGGSNSAFGQGALQKTNDPSNASNASLNSAFGASALNNNTTASGNSAFGAGALFANTTGSGNTAVGTNALFANTTGIDNTALGTSALEHNTSDSNTAVGTGALLNSSTGGANTAVGSLALQTNTIGINNTAVGTNALINNTGNSNIAIGAAAGANATTGSNNIYIGNTGAAGDANTIEVGVQGTQKKTVIAGITNAIITGGTSVVINASGQLGIAMSSRRFKYNIADMGQASNKLLQLRPVTFRYKEAQADGSHPLQYGLIAEEVEEVYPELVTYGADGQAETVQYHVLPTLLLSELQKQQRQIQGQRERILELTGEVRRLRKIQQAMAQLDARLVRLESQQRRAQAPVPNDKARDRSNGPATTQGR